MGKGSKRRPSSAVGKFEENFEKIFGKFKPEGERTRYRHHPDTGELVPDYMWEQLNMVPKTPPRGHFIHRDYEPYQSIIDDTVVSGRRQRRYDMERSGSRPYEGREIEQQEADRFRKYKEEKFERTLEQSLRETANDLKYKNVRKETRIKSGWIFGDDA
jgi:hypothetical protein